MAVIYLSVELEYTVCYKDSVTCVKVGNFTHECTEKEKI